MSKAHTFTPPQNPPPLTAAHTTKPNPVPAMTAALEAIYPSDVAEERARNLAHFLGTLTFPDIPSLWSNVLKAIALRWEHADPYATSGRASDKDSTIERVALSVLRAWVLTEFEAPAGEFVIFSALAGLGVPECLLKAAA